MAVFPFLGNYGHGYDDSGQGVMRLYPGDPPTWRFYKEANSVLTIMPLVFSRYDKTRMDSIRAFFAANKFAKFFVYDPAVVTAVDGSGASATGRHDALFYADDGEPPRLSVRNIGGCLFDCEVRFVLLS